MSDELLRVEILDESGIFTARQTGRAVADEARLEAQDQIRVATALSEVGRDLLGRVGPVTVAFLLDRELPAALVVEVSYRLPSVAESPGEGVAAAARLMDLVGEETTDDRVIVRMRKGVPPGSPPVDEIELGAMRERLARLVPSSALDEFRRQNAELLRTLEDVSRLNAELEETNRGVLALYNQLSVELEETNRGVVALYAELDDKSAQLAEASEIKNRFWANISHELRTPVNSIIGLVRLLLGPGADPLSAEQRHQAALIERSGETLLGLVNELLDMAKAESGRLEPQPGPVDVAAVLAQLRAELEPMAGDGTALVVDAGGAPDLLVTDEVMLSRVLRNLVSNGLKFTPSGEVRLTVTESGGSAVFEVADTGVGIPEEHRQRVFEEFYQAPDGRTRGGTGLGLPYARRLTELLGGELKLESEPGAGTRVTVQLPRPPAGPARAGHLLLVDDDPEFRRWARTPLEGVAERVTEALDAAAALAAVRTDPPDIVLLDLFMPGPGLDGLAVLDELPPTLPVIVVTSADVDATAEPRLRRAISVIRKDRLTGPRLLEVIRRVLEGRNDH